MLILLIFTSLLLTTLSPVIGYLYIVSVGGTLLYRQDKYPIIFYVGMMIGLVALLSFEIITILEVVDIACGVLFVSIIFISILRVSDNYASALYFSGILQIIYGVVRFLLFSATYQKRLEVFFAGYKGFIEQNMASFNEIGEQFISMLSIAQKLMYDYQVAIWSITMLGGMYLAMVFLARKFDARWKHRLIRFPFWLSYILIIVLLLAVLPNTRTVGFNGLLALVVFFIIQGLSIVDFIASNHLKKSRFVMIVTVALVLMNVIFAITVAILGLLDYWLDIRKLNQ